MAEEIYTKEALRAYLLRGLRIVIQEFSRMRRLPRKVFLAYLGGTYLVILPWLMISYKWNGQTFVGTGSAPLLLGAFWGIGCFVFWVHRHNAIVSRVDPVLTALFQANSELRAFKRWVKTLEKADDETLLKAYFQKGIPFPAKIKEEDMVR